MVVSGYLKSSMLPITKDVVLCLLKGTCITDARAAAVNRGTMPNLVTVYARWAGEEGPPVAFPGVTLTPSRNNRRCSLTWHLSGLSPLCQHLGPALPCGGGGGGGGGAG